MSPDPIEITEKDLIERPADLGESVSIGKEGTNPMAWLKQIQGGLDQLKAIMDTARSLGLNVNLPGLKVQGQEGQGGQGAGVNPVSPVPNQQFALFMEMLKVKYGDVTVNELIEQLRAEFGNKKLSQLGKGF